MVTIQPNELVALDISGFRWFAASVGSIDFASKNYNFSICLFIATDAVDARVWIEAMILVPSWGSVQKVQI